MTRLYRQVLPPASFIWEEMNARGWNRHQLAQILGISVELLSDVLMERTSITPEIAQRLGTALGTSAELWLALQAAYDEAQKRVCWFQNHQMKAQP
ncbi:MAG: HigA family addiction module antitoxin [Dehalococcoidia bacterium]|nr:HigA family addiction module antitoxin [Dehalococcoidia bacterium]